MAGPLRIERPGGWYHLTARGNERRPLFRDDRDRQHFCQLLAEMVDRFHVRLHGYVLMDNHYHLILELREANLSRAAQWLNLSYSVWFNRRHGRSGHLFQGRFKSVIVSREEWGLALSRCVHLNPVRVGALGRVYMLCNWGRNCAIGVASIHYTFDGKGLAWAIIRASPRATLARAWRAVLGRRRLAATPAGA